MTWIFLAFLSLWIKLLRINPENTKKNLYLRRQQQSLDKREENNNLWVKNLLLLSFYSSIIWCFFYINNTPQHTCPPIQIPISLSLFTILSLPLILYICKYKKNLPKIIMEGNLCHYYYATLEQHTGYCGFWGHTDLCVGLTLLFHILLPTSTHKLFFSLFFLPSFVRYYN